MPTKKAPAARGAKSAAKSPAKTAAPGREGREGARSAPAVHVGTAPTAEQVRVFRWRRQGLDGSLRKATAAEVLERTGWIRSVGGSSPYVAIRARGGLTREAMDAAAARLEIHELPAVRGCTYVVPASDFALALRAGQRRADEGDVAQAKRHLGATEAELETLSTRVLDALGKREMDPAGIKETVGDAVRSLGPEGKKRGLTTTLPLVLGRLQAQGLIRRVPTNGRLDQQRYRYALWTPSPLPARPLSDNEVALELARRFFRWAAPATVEQLAWWAGLGVKAARTAAARAGVVPVVDGDPRLIFPEDLDALRSAAEPASPALSFLPSLDNLMHPRRDVASLLLPADAERLVPATKGCAAVGTLSDLENHAIVDRGRLIGLWEWDGIGGELVGATFGKAPAGLASEAKALATYIREQLGDVRSFSLDSPESRTSRLDFLRNPGW